MAKWGKADFSELIDTLKRLEAVDDDQLCRSMSKELAARLLALVIPKTPVGQYPSGSGKVGGTLRRGWSSKTHEEAASGKSKDAMAYVQSLPITKSGDTYTIEIINPVEYSSFVEYGHRTVNGGWVKGRYMLTISEEKLQRIAPSVLEKRLQRAIEEAMNGRN